MSYEPEMVFPDSPTRSPMAFTIDDRCVVLLVKIEGEWRPTSWWTREACELLPVFFAAHSSVDAAGVYLEIE